MATPLDRIPLPPQAAPGSVEATGQPAPHPVVPLTERILARLPGRRPVWVFVWAALPFAYAALSATLDLTTGLGPTSRELITAGAYSYAIALSLWAVRKMARDAAAVAMEVTALRKHEETPSIFRGRAAEQSVAVGLEEEPRYFRDMGSVAIPLGLTLATSVAGSVAAVLILGPWPGLLLWPLPLLVNLPLMTALWSYLSVLIGLDRLGRQKLHLDDTFPEDPLLGLRPVGSLAFSVFLIMVAGFIPVLLVSLVSPLFLILDLLLFVPGVTLFVLSLYRLHRQMAATRRRHMRRARELYARAFGPPWASGELEDWRRDSGLLQAVTAIEQRATTIRTWPFSPGVGAWIVGISTSLAVTIVGRLLLGVLGL